MAFSADELNLVNQALGRIGSTTISATENGSDKCDTYVKANLHYSQTREALQRSADWNFAKNQAQLVQIKTLTLNHQPLPDTWVVGDTITGITSGETAEILTVTSPTQYEIIYQSGDFEDNETLTNATVYDVLWEGIPLTWEDEDVVWYDSSVSDETTCDIEVAEIVPTFQYDYQFQLPDDYSRLKKNYDGGNEWTILGKRLLSNYDEVDLEYIKKVTDPADFDALFYEVLVLQLALKLITPLGGTQTTTFRQELRSELQYAKAEARTVCAVETNNTGESMWNDARFGSGVV